MKFAFNSVSFEDFLVFGMRKSRKLSSGNMFLSSLYVTTVILLIPYRFCKWSQSIVKRKKKTWKMLHSLWPPSPPNPDNCLFSLSVSLSLSSQPPLPVLTLIKLARPPGGGVAGVAAPPPAHLLSSCLQATHFCGLKSTHRWASIQSSLWAATLCYTGVLIRLEGWRKAIPRTSISQTLIRPC